MESAPVAPANLSMAAHGLFRVLILEPRWKMPDREEKASIRPAAGSNHDRGTAANDKGRFFEAL
jgi:hypothetical protein